MRFSVAALIRRRRALRRHWERQLRARHVKELTDAKARHARVLAANLQVAMVNVRVALDALADPTQLVALVTEARSSPKRLLDHIDRATRGAFAVTQLVECERLTLGLAGKFSKWGIAWRRREPT
jgi:hypothetical protein